jgi:ketosteroid isomerase-like protein
MKASRSQFGRRWHPELQAATRGLSPGNTNISVWRALFAATRVSPAAHRPGDCALSVTSVAPVLDDLAAAMWVQEYDAAWLRRDWERLQKRLAPEVEFVIPGAPDPVVGSAFVVATLRDIMAHTRIHEYNATDLQGYDCGTIGVITYLWSLDWTVRDGAARSQSTGRDVLVLRAAAGCWLLTWRGQFLI